jgi:DNA-binding transcriptional LysR family regulator
MLYDRHLHSFAVVAEEGSLSKAASRLFISQPALTQQINLLEEELSVALFHRTNRGVTLTAAGEALYKDAGRIMALCDKAVGQVRDIASRVSGSLHIGARPDIASSVLKRVCHEFAVRHPDVEQVFTSMPVDDLICAVADGTVDVSAFYDTNLPRRDEVSFVHLATEPVVFLVHPDNKLVHKETITLMDLTGVTVALVAEGKTRNADEVRRLISASGLSITVVDRDKDRATRIRNGLDCAVTTAPAGIADFFAPLVAIPMSQAVYAELGLICPRESTPVVSCFLDVARELYEVESRV